MRTIAIPDNEPVEYSWAAIPSESVPLDILKEFRPMEAAVPQVRFMGSRYQLLEPISANEAIDIDTGEIVKLVWHRCTGEGTATVTIKG